MVYLKEERQALQSSYVTSRGHCSGVTSQNAAQNQHCWKHPRSMLSLRPIRARKSDYTVSYTDSLERASSGDTFQDVPHSCIHPGSCLASSWYQTTDNPSKLTLLLKPQPKHATPLLSESFQDIFSYKIREKNTIKKSETAPLRWRLFYSKFSFCTWKEGRCFEFSSSLEHQLSEALLVEICAWDEELVTLMQDWNKRSSPCEITTLVSHKTKTVKQTKKNILYS